MNSWILYKSINKSIITRSDFIINIIIKEYTAASEISTPTNSKLSSGGPYKTLGPEYIL